MKTSQTSAEDGILVCSSGAGPTCWLHVCPVSTAALPLTRGPEPAVLPGVDANSLKGACVCVCWQLSLIPFHSPAFVLTHGHSDLGCGLMAARRPSTSSPASPLGQQWQVGLAWAGCLAAEPRATLSTPRPKDSGFGGGGVQSPQASRAMCSGLGENKLPRWPMSLRS